MKDAPRQKLLGLAAFLPVVALGLSWVFRRAFDVPVASVAGHAILGAWVLFATGVLALYADRLLAAERERADRDGLTGLLNQSAFLKAVTLIRNTGLRSQDPIAVVLIDVDEFKRINDSHNHMTGNRALKRLGDTLRQCVRLSDVPARFGGDEFALCLPDTTLENATVVAERIRKAIELTPVPDSSRPVHMTLSIGICATKCDRSLDAARMVDAADDALYQAKRGGGNRVAYREVAPAKDKDSESRNSS